MSTKLAIVFYSSTGTNFQLAQWAAEGAKEAGAEVRLLKVPELMPQAIVEADPAKMKHQQNVKEVPEVSPEDLEWADAIIFSVSARFGNMASPMKAFFDSLGGLWFQGKLANKVVSAMTSAQNPHGGQEAVILSLYTSMYHWGAIVAAPGYTDQSIFGAGGNPYGVSVSVNGEGEIQGDIDAIKAAANHQAKRTVTVAGWVKQG
ncbi:NAD(P)H:quinone oxidoreductase type IV [Anoxynatronum buryatiense]|uniref:NAD(P)H dehydrogenase (Quinone) n=1 Tax=Anoxynatronum buryatiense TaxID=489973 RepID=A0AA45WU19_9CLOT|nr:NAD(P)H:quinone oxidoreductase type IV [Anoxynatronum buryatiense]SMP45710.1 NAD(P)H dehydrogenase (quinone) [Anoxynatronum buryatiense]